MATPAGCLVLGSLLLGLPLAAVAEAGSSANADAASPARPRPSTMVLPPATAATSGEATPATPAGPVAVSTAGFYRLDVGYWSYQPRGTATFSGSTVDFQRDLGLRARRKETYRAEWSANLADTAHPWYLPVQVSADYLNSGFAGQQVIQPTTLLSLGPIVISQNGTTVNTSTRFRDAGASVGWRLWQFLPGARLEGGIVLKNVVADIDVFSPNQNQETRQSANATFPLPSLAVVAGRGGLRLRTEAQYGRISGREALNAEALVNWQPAFARYLGLQAGWRYRRYRFEANDAAGDRFDLHMSGLRLGARIEFGPTP